VEPARHLQPPPSEAHAANTLHTHTSNITERERVRARAQARGKLGEREKNDSGTTHTPAAPHCEHQHTKTHTQNGLFAGRMFQRYLKSDPYLLGGLSCYGVSACQRMSAHKARASKCPCMPVFLCLCLCLCLCLSCARHSTKRVQPRCSRCEGAPRPRPRAGQWRQRLNIHAALRGSLERGSCSHRGRADGQGIKPITEDWPRSVLRFSTKGSVRTAMDNAKANADGNADGNGTALTPQVLTPQVNSSRPPASLA
jgi:hypothetical protein